MRAALVLLATLLLAACGGSDGDRAARDGAVPPRDVRSIADFQRLFDDDRGSARLVVLLSPT